MLTLAFIPQHNCAYVPTDGAASMAMDSYFLLNTVLFYLFGLLQMKVYEGKITHQSNCTSH